MAANATAEALAQVVTDPEEVQFYRSHGWWLWVCWGILSYTMLLTKRYMNFAWFPGQLLHSLVGYFITIVTLVWSFKALAFAQWVAGANPHIALGLIVLSLVFVVAITGIASIMLGRFCPSKSWTHHKEAHNMVGSFHKYAGYFIIMCGIAATSSGLIVYQQTYDLTNDKRYV